MSVTVVNEANFESEVLNSDKKVLCDFWASWCGPCRMLSPVVDELANEHPEIKVCKINVDENPSLAVRFNIASIPQLLVFDGGKVSATSVGVRPKHELEELLK